MTRKEPLGFSPRGSWLLFLILFDCVADQFVENNYDVFYAKYDQYRGYCHLPVPPKRVVEK